MTPPRVRIKTFCFTCNKDIEKVPSQLKKINFCSKSCSYEYYSGRPRKAIEIQCCYCGKDFLRVPSQVREKGKNFCSKSCKVLQQHQDGKHLIRTIESRIKQSMTVTKMYQDPHTKKLMSERGLKSWENNEERKLKQSLKTKQFWEDGVYDGVYQKNSKMEKELKPLLEKLGFKSTIDTKFRISCNDRTRIPDFYNQATKEIIEVFGVWWHRDRPGINHESEEYVINKYAEVGWKCQVIWEDAYEEYLLSLKELI